MQGGRGFRGLAPFCERWESRLNPRLLRVGKGLNPVVVIDDFTGTKDAAIAAAASLAPFPDARANYYPGVRRVIGEGDGDAERYVTNVMESVGPFIAGAFDVMTYRLVEASFSVVTAPPETLLPMQRAPHFDTTDPDTIAMIHYLHVPGQSATAFFRHRGTGIERVDECNVDTFVTAARIDAAQQPEGHAYVQGGDAHYDELERVEARPDRLVFYQGGLLHSGIIPPTMPLDPDPRRGRLTANFFLTLDRRPT